MLKKLLIYLLLFTMLLGEKKLFYNPDSVILYDITSLGIRKIKQKKLCIGDNVNLEEIIKKRKIVFIGNYREVVIKYAEYDENKKVYNVYYEVGFVTPQSQFSLTKIVIMGVYDENFNYLAIEEYPTYEYDQEEEMVEEIQESKNGAVAFFKLSNHQDRKTLKYSYGKKELYLIRHKDGSDEFNNKNIKEVFSPALINKNKTFILGMGSLSGTIKDNRLYKYDLKTEKIEILKEFAQTAVFLETLIDNDQKVIYSTLSPYENINEYGNKGRKIYILDLKNLKIKELKLSDEVFEEFYYSHEIRNVNKKLIEKFSESM